MNEGYVLAMYDVRGKQNFIFRTNKLQEIVGGSWIIRDIFEDYLFPAAKEIIENSKGIYSYKKKKDKNPFTKDGFEVHLAKGYVGEVVYDGGGNFLVVFKDEQTFQDITYEFSKRVMKDIGTLRVQGTCVPVSGGETQEKELFYDYENDRKKLQEAHRHTEAEESLLAPWSALPIVQVNKKTSQVLVDYEKSDNTFRSDLGNELDIDISVLKRIKQKGLNGKVTKESFAKLKKFYEEYDRIQSEKNENELTEDEKAILQMVQDSEKILDSIVEEKGKDSNLAVLFIDGNNMGARVQNITEGKTSYEESTKVLREFSDHIQRIYIENGVRNALESIDSSDDKAFRIVVFAGDETNFIVKAKDAFYCAKAYLEYLQNAERYKGQIDSSCAGIAVFNSHAPYADAYRIAEEACESGKQKMKKTGIENASFIDFHIIQGAIGTSLDDIRKDENRGFIKEDEEKDVISRPWMIWNKDIDKDVSKVTDYQKVERIVKLLRNFSRTNVKGLAWAAKTSDVTLTMELNRMYAHLPEEKQKIIKAEWEDLKNMDKVEKRNILYDISIAYDLWFADGDKADNQEASE